MAGREARGQTNAALQRRTVGGVNDFHAALESLADLRRRFFAAATARVATHLRPRAFWTGTSGAKLYLTAGVMQEDRFGGTKPGRTKPDGNPFPQSQRTKRLDGGLVAEIPISDIGTGQIKFSGVSQRHRHQFFSVIENDRHGTLFAEASLAGSNDGTAWAGGVAWQADEYKSLAFPAFDYRYEIPGVMTSR